MSNSPDVQRDSFKSRFGMIMSIAGMSIGLGNCWKFPYLCGKWGGGAFVFVYLIGCILVIVPLAIVEVSMGKRTQAGLVQTYGDSFRCKPVGYVLGSVSSFGMYAVNFYYVVILGAIVYFIGMFATRAWNRTDVSTMYDSYTGSVASVVIYVIIMVIMVYTALKGINKGIEKVSKIMVPSLFILFFITFIILCCTTPNMVDGLNYYLNPDFSQLGNINLWIAAIGQALFSVGVGPGCLLIYGSHLKEDAEITKSVLTICVLDTCVGLLSGLCIIPACIAYGVDPESGSTLIFRVLPVIFEEMPLGAVIGVLLFIGMFFAAFTSAIANQEVALTTFVDAYHLPRPAVAVALGIINLCIGLPCLFSEGWYNLWVNVTGDYLYMPAAAIGGIAYVYCYGVRKLRENNANPYSDIKLGRWFDRWVQIIALPIMIFLTAWNFIALF